MTTPLGERALQRLRAIAAETDEVAPPPALPPRYELVRELGRGGMGVVYEVLDRQLGRRCALKTLGAAAGADAESRRRFVREAQAASRLRHPHIAAIHEATDEFLVMQLVEGGPIGTAADTPLRALVGSIRDAASALQHAHEQGIVHRDLKPSNLLVENGHVYVVDFGLSKRLDVASSLSLAGAVVGTPGFMPPEQASGRHGQVDARSDVYGLGATLHHCIAGAPPFAAADLPTLLRMVVESDPPRLPGDRDLALVVARCLAKEPDRRYPSMRELALDLDRWLAGRPVTARPPSLGYRLQKALRRHRALWRAAAFACTGTLLVLGPLWLRESGARAAANAAVELADDVAAGLRDAALFRRLGDRDSAEQELEVGIASVRAFLADHEVPRVRYLLGRLLRACERHDEALVELGRAVAAEPTLLDARFERGLSLAAVREPSAAEIAAAVADLAVDPGPRSVLGDVDRLFGQAERARLLGDSERAFALLQEVLEYDPVHVPAHLALSRTALALGQDGLAGYYAAIALDLQQGHGPFYLARERGSLPVSILGLQGLLVDFTEELRGAPDNALALAHRGLVQLRRAVRLDGAGRRAEAVRAVRAAIADHDAVLELHERVAGALNNRAVCRLMLDALTVADDPAAAVAAREAAAVDLGRVLDEAPESAAAHGNSGQVALRRAQALRAIGRPDRAAVSAAQAVASFDRALRSFGEGAQAAWCRAQRDAAMALAAGGR